MRRSPRHLTLMVVVGALVAVAAFGSIALVFGAGSYFDSLPRHEDLVSPQARNPNPPPPDGPLNFLVLGADSRDGTATVPYDSTGSRSDTIMLVHIAKGLKSAFIVSIPRDSYVDVMPVPGKWSGGKSKINAAFSHGGAKAAIDTIYNLTKVPIDGAVIVDFIGLENVVNAVGGVHVCPLFDVPNWFDDFAQYGPDKIGNYHGWKKGKCYDMTGEEAMVFSRQRKLVASGDFGRMKDQQLVVKALVEKAASSGILTNPIKFTALLAALGRSLTIDNRMNMLQLAFTLKGISPSAITFATTPYTGAGPVGSESVVFLDPKADEALWKAIRDDKTAEWLAVHPQPDEPSWSPNNNPVVNPTGSP